MYSTFKSLSAHVYTNQIVFFGALNLLYTLNTIQYYVQIKPKKNYIQVM